MLKPSGRCGRQPTSAVFFATLPNAPRELPPYGVRCRVSRRLAAAQRAASRANKMQPGAPPFTLGAGPQAPNAPLLSGNAAAAVVRAPPPGAGTGPLYSALRLPQPPGRTLLAPPPALQPSVAKRGSDVLPVQPAAKKAGTVGSRGAPGLVGVRPAAAPSAAALPTRRPAPRPPPPSSQPERPQGADPAQRHLVPVHKRMMDRLSFLQTLLFDSPPDDLPSQERVLVLVLTFPFINKDHVDLEVGPSPILTPDPDERLLLEVSEIVYAAYSRVMNHLQVPQELRLFVAPQVMWQLTDFTVEKALVGLLQKCYSREPLIGQNGTPYCPGGFDLALGTVCKLIPHPDPFSAPPPPISGASKGPQSGRIRSRSNAYLPSAEQQLQEVRAVARSSSVGAPGILTGAHPNSEHKDLGPSVITSSKQTSKSPNGHEGTERQDTANMRRQQSDHTLVDDQLQNNSNGEFREEARAFVIREAVGSPLFPSVHTQNRRPGKASERPAARRRKFVSPARGRMPVRIENSHGRSPPQSGIEPAKQQAQCDGIPQQEKVKAMQSSLRNKLSFLHARLSERVREAADARYDERELAKKPSSSSQQGSAEKLVCASNPVKPKIDTPVFGAAVVAGQHSEALGSAPGDNRVLMSDACDRAHLLGKIHESDVGSAKATTPDHEAPDGDDRRATSCDNALAVSGTPSDSPKNISEPAGFLTEVLVQSAGLTPSETVQQHPSTHLVSDSHRRGPIILVPTPDDQQPGYKGADVSGRNMPHNHGPGSCALQADESDAIPALAVSAPATSIRSGVLGSLACQGEGSERVLSYVSAPRRLSRPPMDSKGLTEPVGPLPTLQPYPHPATSPDMDSLEAHGTTHTQSDSPISNLEIHNHNDRPPVECETSDDLSLAISEGGKSGKSLQLLQWPDACKGRRSKRSRALKKRRLTSVLNNKRSKHVRRRCSGFVMPCKKCWAGRLPCGH